MGAIIAQVVFGPLRQRGAPPGSDESPWLDHVMEIFALFMLCGLFTTFLIPETKRKTLEELAGEVPGTANYDPGSRSGAYKTNSNPHNESAEISLNLISDERSPGFDMIGLQSLRPR